MAMKLDALVAYFNDSLRVVRASAELGIPGKRHEAEAFFAAREALGLRGYLSSDEAKRAILSGVGGLFNEIGASLGGKAVQAARTPEERSAFARKGGEAARGRPRRKRAT